MAARVTIDKSLVIRYGNNTYQLHRVLAEPLRLQFENQLTGDLKVFEMSLFHSMIQSEKIVPLLGEIAEVGEGRLGKDRQILDMSALPEKQKNRISFCLQVVRHLRKLGITRGQRDRVAKTIEKMFATGEWKNVWSKKEPPKTSAVMSWMRDFEMSGCNPAVFLGGNFNRKRKKTISQAVEETMEWALKTYYLKRARYSLTYAYERLKIRLQEMVRRGEISEDVAQISFASFQRRRNELDPYYVIAQRYNAAHANQKFRYTITGTTVNRAMARLEIDHTLLNWVVICDRTGLPLGRPTLTIIVDSYSGYIVGLYVSFNGPGLTTVINVIKNGISPKYDLGVAAGASNPWIAWGIGDSYRLDNGMEFHAKILRAIAWELCCDLEYCRVRFPWLKPKVERTFAELDYLPLSAGRVHKPDSNILNIDPKKDAAITLSLLCKGLVKFAVDIHATQTNNRTLEKSFDLFKESLELNPLPELPDTMKGLDLIAAMSKQMTVAQGGVELMGLSYAGYDLKELLRSAGGKFKTLVKWNPDDLGYVHVRHGRTQEWHSLFCTRPDYANGLSWNTHRLLRKFKRDDLGRSGTIDQLLIAKQDLHECWMNPLAKKNKSLELNSARRMSQLCSTASTFQDASADKPRLPTAAIAPEEMAYESSEVPDFEAVAF